MRGFTLVEMLIVIVVLSVLISAALVPFNTVIETWGSQDAALEIREEVRQGVEKMLRDLRPAKAISVADDSVRYTVDESGTDNNYIFYLYNSSETWVPDYDETVYELRRAPLTGGISGTFTYGDGSLYAKNIKPPTTSDLSSSGNVVTIDLTITKYDETYRLLEKIRPRNL